MMEDFSLGICDRCHEKATLTNISGYINGLDKETRTYDVCEYCLEFIQNIQRGVIEDICNPDMDVCGVITVDYKNIDKLASLLEGEPEFEHIVKWLKDVKDDATCYHKARCKE